MVHVFAGRSSMVLFADRAGANAGTDIDSSQLKLAGCSTHRNTCRSFILGVGSYKACSWCHTPLSADSDRSRIKAESWTAAFEYRYSLRSWTALGTTECAPT